MCSTPSCSFTSTPWAFVSFTPDIYSVPGAPRRMPTVNDRVYIHEIIDVIGHNRAHYMRRT